MQQQQPQPQQPPAPKADRNDPVAMLNEVLSNQQSAPQQFATSQPQQQNMNAFNSMGGGMGAMGGQGMNPFANQGLSYQNPNHNKASYATSAPAGGNPFDQGGPSASSWQRDANALGFNVQIAGGSEPKKNNNDNIAEFKDLFAFGTNSIKTQEGAKKGGIDLSYNPGVAPA